MKTIKLEMNEFIIDDEIDISVNAELCFSETIEISNDCIRKVNKCVIWIPSRSYICVCSIILFLVGLFPMIIAFIYRDTELFILFYLGVFAMLCIPLIILSCKLGIKKKKGFINTAKIYPAEILSASSYKKWYEGTDGGGGWETHYQINYRVYICDDAFTKKFKFSTAIGWHRKDKGEIFNYYKKRKYMFVLFKQKNKKTYPVRLLRKTNPAIEATNVAIIDC